MNNVIPSSSTLIGFLRLPQVLNIVPISSCPSATPAGHHQGRA